MEYQTLDSIQTPLSRIIYGTANRSFFGGSNMEDILDEAVALGITTFDTARVYQKSEEVIGQWLRKRNLRDRLVLISKCAHPDNEHPNRLNEHDIRFDLAQSLSNLGTDYLDIYLLHRDVETVPVSILVEIMNALHAEGKIKRFGGSNWQYERIEEANEYAYKHNLIPFTISSPHYSLAEQVGDPWGSGCASLTGKANKQARLWYEKQQMPILAYSSLSQGFLSGKMKSADAANIEQYFDSSCIRGYASELNIERLRRCEQLALEKQCSVAELALAWVLHSHMNVFPIVTTQTCTRLRQNMTALQISLTEEQWQWLLVEMD